MDTTPYIAVAYYHFFPLEDPHAEVARYKEFFLFRDVKCRIYLSKEGVNAQMSISQKELNPFLEWLKNDPRYKDVEVKMQPCKEHAFYKMTVKVRNQLVAFDQPVDLSKRGHYLTPKEWKEKLEKQEENRVIVDVRNQYESDIGHFDGAVLPPCDTFREFADYAEELKKKVDPEKGTVMMYCTGGIRCEYYSSFLKEKGFQNVYQLHGGVIQYGLDEGEKHWKGKLFVFDDRLGVPLSETEGNAISLCQHCKKPSDIYYNCANMDCNELFTSCPSCAEKFVGCCSEQCTHAPRLRSFDNSSQPKPFRKWSFEEKAKMKQNG